MFELEFFPAQRSIWFRVFAVWDKVQVFGVGTGSGSLGSCLVIWKHLRSKKKKLALIDLRTATTQL